MNEALRIAYLQAMDIDCLVSRRDLPGARPSRRVAVVRRSKEASAPPASGDPLQVLRADRPARPAARKPVAQPAPVISPSERPAADATAAELPIFSLAVTAAGGCLWLDQLPPGRSAGGDYAQLLEAICLALELPAGAAEVSLFSFPMKDLPLVDRGLSAARDALQGYLARRLEQIQPRAVVLLGDIEEPWFNRGCLESCPVVVTVSAWQMLRQPELKRAAWSDLQALRGNVA